MKHATMKILYTLILVLLAGTAYGQSNLPACQGSNFSQWHNCFGNLIDASGDKYLGEFKNGTFNGQGTYFYANGDEYLGEFKDGNKNGQGIFFFVNDDKYEGEYKDDKKNGQGTYYYLAKDQFKGDKYVGEYKDGKKKGQGTYYFLADNQFKGNKYVGEFKDGDFNGQGTYFYANGDVYVGEFKDGMKNGQDIFIKTDKFIVQNSVKPSASNNSTVEKEQLGIAYGQSNLPACQGSDASKWSRCIGEETLNGHSQYKGEFLNGKRHGFGVMNALHPDFKGDKYVGEYKDGNYNGQGTFTWADGEKYVGEFKDHKLNGQGTYTFANGNKYVGEYKDGKRNGQGTFTWLNGDRYDGEWKDDKSHGRGIVYNVNGSIEESGIYKDDKLVTSQYIDPNSFTRIARNSTAPAVSDSQRQAIEQRERQVELEAGQSKLPACQGSDDSRWTNCFGSWTYSSGDKYVGEYKDGKQNGQGTYYSLADNQFKGDKYVGEWKDDKKDGQGTSTFANGNKYVGEYKDNKKHGQGTFYYLA